MAFPVVLAGVLVLGGLFAADQPDRQAAAASKVLTNSIGMKLAFIPAGKFLMGSPPGEAEREEGEVQHEVTITKPFYMGVYEVTQREFKQVLGEAVKRPAIFNENQGGGPDHPMDSVVWPMATDFCSTLSGLAEERKAGRRYRLPTEAEWEYACRAGTATAFHFGDSLSSKRANFNGGFPYGGGEKGPYLRMTAKVGSYPPNGFGLHDMHGNLCEWCSDYYDKDYYRKSPREDPKGPEQGVVHTDYEDFYRVIRGGCWLDEARACRSAYRFKAMPNEPNRLVGFRVVCEVDTKGP
jgi:formylglycine-generating enzyme required for sulfatase activity